MCILYVCVVCFEVCYGMEVSVCVLHAHEPEAICTCGGQRSEQIDLWRINLETVPLTDPEADWPVSSQDSPVSASRCWGYRQVKTRPPYVCVRDLSPGIHVFLESVLTRWAISLAPDTPLNWITFHKPLTVEGVKDRKKGLWTRALLVNTRSRVQIQISCIHIRSWAWRGGAFI